VQKIKPHTPQTKSTSQTPRIFNRNAILLATTALGLCVWSAVPPAAGCIPTTTWTYAGSGSWFDRTKWSNGVPDSSDDTFISYAGTANIDSTGAAACNLTLGYNPADSGNVSIGGGTLTLSVINEVEVGGYGKGTLSITNGARVTASILTIAALQGNSGQLSVGTVSVDGATFTISGRAGVGGDQVTTGGIGLMSVTNGGTVSAATVRVFGSGTLTGNGTVTVASGSGTATFEGTLAPSGQLTISGNLTFDSTAATMQSNVVPAGADNVSVSGTATLTGRLSVTMTGTFTCGTTRYTLLHSQGVLSSFFSSVSISYPTNQGFTPQITYDYVGNHVYLDLVFNNGCH
jgi:T5SS/PEP-CTERM-associated repeat protein